MRKEVRFLFVFLAIFIIALLCVILPHWTLDLPVFIPLGSIIIGFWMFMEAITEICRGRTEHIIYNRGHMSVREKDIIKIPYHEKSVEEGESTPTALGDMIVACLNGFDYFGFTMPGSKADPILIYPSINHGKEENNYHSYGNLTKYKFRELPGYVKEILKLYPNRIDQIKTPIFYGMTSHFMGNATKENVKIEAREKELNRDLTEKENLIDKLYEQLIKQKTADEKQYILGNVIKPKEERESR